MQLLKPGLMGISLLFAMQAAGQIITKPKQPDPVPEVTEDTVRAKRVPTDGQDEFAFYLGTGIVFSNRSLEPNKAPFGEPLGIRAGEKMLNTWSFQLGLRNRVGRFVSYDGALSLEKFGESYDYKDDATDSSYVYTTRYSYFSLPVQAFFTTGKDFRFFIGGGLQPGLLTGYRQELRYTTAENSETKETFKSAKNMNQFTLGVIASAGLQVRLSEQMSVYLIPSYIYNLTSTYTDQAEYIHRSMALSLKFGLLFQFPNGEVEKD